MFYTKTTIEINHKTKAKQNKVIKVPKFLGSQQNKF